MLRLGVQPQRQTKLAAEVPAASRELQVVEVVVLVAVLAGLVVGVVAASARLGFRQMYLAVVELEVARVAAAEE